MKRLCHRPKSLERKAIFQSAKNVQAVKDVEYGPNPDK